MSAIGIKIHKPKGEYDLGASKFFGAPVLPAGWLDKFSDDVIFFAQIRLSDIANSTPKISCRTRVSLSFSRCGDDVRVYGLLL